MGDSCCPIEFICEHYLTFSELLSVSLCLLCQRRNYGEILKTRGFDRGKGELENVKGSKHESTFTFKLVY